MRNNNQLKMGSILSYLQMALSVIIQLVYTPVMIRLLGKHEYGLYQTVASTISMLSILSLGFNSGYIKYYSIYKKRDDRSAINRLNGLFMVIFTIIGFVGLLCGLFLSFHLDLVFDEGLTSEEYTKARIMMLLLTANLTVSFPMSVFQNIISAHERFVFLKLLGMVKTVVSPLVTLPLLLNGYRSIAMVTVTVAISLLVDLVYLVYVLFKMQEKFVFKDFEKGIFKKLFAYTAFIALNIVIDQINWNIDKLLLGRYKGTAEVAVYSVGYTLYQSYMLFSTSVSGVFTPRIHKIVNATKDDIAEQRTQLTELFTRVGRLQFIILSLIASGIVFFGKFFITGIWAGKGYDNSYFVALLLVIPASIALIQNLGIEIQRAENKHQFRSIAYAVMALINLGLSIVLCQKYGAVGSAIGTAISLVIANGLVMNIYYNRHCNIDIPLFWRNILRQSLGLIIPICTGIMMIMYIEIKSVFIFGVCVLAYTAIYCISMWLFGMNDYEKDLVRKPINKIHHR
ncbi:oligosaccharide flippase family protein [Ruminococcus sp.]|uniref:oligosaccharide flippase family protein n=1 Tax=Ruminococcus sp. TaxID=41978 RepID=UPI002583F8EE|nr:oligosaccharide flippase family protein [Ruminococcus sp.]MCR5021831.1 oligosaccharide flippase family protein [Ruminococcus sp.]